MNLIALIKTIIQRITVSKRCRSAGKAVQFRCWPQRVAKGLILVFQLERQDRTIFRKSSTVYGTGGRGVTTAVHYGRVCSFCRVGSLRKPALVTKKTTNPGVRVG